MNIFLLDYDQRKCAEYHCDKHVVKMIVEYAQLLSSAHRVLDGQLTSVVYTTPKGQQRTKKLYILPDEREHLLYKATHINHPCAVWARTSAENYNHLFWMLHFLCKEYTLRYKRVHKVEFSKLLLMLASVPDALYSLSFDKTPYPQTMPDQYKCNDPVKAYRSFYLGEKMGFAKWTNSKIPKFVSEAFTDTSIFERTK